MNVEDGAVKTAEATKAKANEAFRKANVAGLADDLKLVGGKNEKTDAYSVFGSFDANTKAGAEAGGSSATKGEVTLVIGKVFSTGVASQNLTEGMRRYYSGMGAAQTERAKVNCLTVGDVYISKLKDTLKLDTEEGKKQLAKMIESIIDTCGKGLDDVESRITAQLKSTKN